MRILFFIRCLTGVTGGAERAVLNLSSQLVARGYKVSIATFDEFQGAPFYSYDPRVKIVNLNQHAQPLEEAVTASQMRMQAKKKKERKVRTVLKNSIGIARLLSPFNERYLQRKEEAVFSALKHFVEQEKPSCMVGFMVDTNRVVGRCGQDTGIPSVLALRNDPELDFKWSHDLMLERLKGKQALKKLTNHTTKVVLVPPFAQELEKRAQGSIAVIPNFIEISKFAPSRSVPLESREKRILFVGRLTDVKRPMQLVEAFSILSKNYPDWLLKIVGEGRLEKPLKDKVQSLGLLDRVDVAGVTADVAKEYQNAQILCQPSKYEGFSQVLGEAMASGVPCIGDARCTSSTYLLDEDRGLLVNGDRLVDALVEGLDQMMGSLEFRQQLSEKAYEFISQHTAENVTDKWEQLLLASCNEH